MKVKIMSQDNALKYASIIDKNILIVSIVGEKESPLEFNSEKVIDVFRMFFEDIERPIDKYKAPSRDDFKGLKEFLDKNIGSVEEIIVHCHAGVSRSAACASAIARYVGVNDSFIWSSDNYMPNRLVFKHAIGELEVNMSNDDIEALYKANEDAHMMSSEFLTEEGFFI